MVQVIKPRTLGLLTKAERRATGASYIVSALAMFDLAGAGELESEQALWLAVAKALPPGTILDIAMPKPVAEVLIAGHARPPEGRPVAAMTVAARIAGFETRLAVIGDRVWRAGENGYAATPPRPFTEMPLDPALAFGGPEHPTNRKGAGHRAAARIAAGELVALPNIERPDRLIHAVDDDPPPASFGAGDLENPARRRFAGTYDRRWLATVAPALPHDVDPRLFMLGAEEQWLDGRLVGDEPYALRGFAADRPVIEGRLPGVRVRAFLTMAHDRTTLIELPMAIDTLWLLVGARRGVLVWRGAQPVADIEAADVADVILSYEHMGAPPRPLAEIAEFRRLRSDPETAARVALTDGPLVPVPDPAADEHRLAARRRHAGAELARRHADTVWASERRLAEAGVPRVLWPELPPPGEPLVLLPTPEEIAAGDIDLGELIDGFEAARRQAEADLVRARDEMAPIEASLAALGRPGAGPGEIDALVAKLARLGGGGDPLDGLAGQLAAATPGPLDVAVDPRQADGLASAAATAADWRRAVLHAARPAAPDEVAEVAEVAAAVGRLLSLPEAAPLAGARRGLDAAAAVDLTGIAVPTPPDEVRPAPATADGGSPLAQARAALADIPAETAATVNDGLARLEDGLRAGMPALRDAASPIETLLAELARPAAGEPADPRTLPARAEEARRDGVAQGLAAIDAAEARLVDGLAEMRRKALMPLYPETPLSPGAARRFGARILAEAAAGLRLAGRDLAGADLAGANLAGLDLDGALLERADLTGARLAGANLTRAALTGARLDGADLSGCRLDEANLAKARLRGANLAGASLDKALLVETDLSNASLERARITAARMIRCTLAAADLTGAALDETVLIECGLADARLDGATVSACQFLMVDLARVRARGATFRASSFIDPNAAAADFTGARIEACGFAGAIVFTEACLDAVEAPDTTWNGGDFRGARFRRARLERAILSGADLSGASLRLASLVRARLDGCRLAGADLAAANLREAQLHRADATGASFRDANLFGADLSDAVIAGADLTGANLARTTIAMVPTLVDG